MPSVRREPVGRREFFLDHGRRREVYDNHLIQGFLAMDLLSSVALTLAGMLVALTFSALGTVGTFLLLDLGRSALLGG